MKKEIEVIRYSNDAIYCIDKFKRALKNSLNKSIEAGQKLSNALKQTKCNIP